jgi:hypothetical protein
MRKTALTILGALLITGSAVQMATASEHQVRNYRRAYNQWNEPIGTAPRTLVRPDTNGFGFRGGDPSWVGGKDPSLNPAGN